MPCFSSNTLSQCCQLFQIHIEMCAVTTSWFIEPFEYNNIRLLTNYSEKLVLTNEKESIKCNFGGK